MTITDEEAPPLPEGVKWESSGLLTNCGVVVSPEYVCFTCGNGECCCKCGPDSKFGVHLEGPEFLPCGCLKQGEDDEDVDACETCDKCSAHCDCWYCEECCCDHQSETWRCPSCGLCDESDHSECEPQHDSSDDEPEPPGRGVSIVPPWVERVGEVVLDLQEGRRVLAACDVLDSGMESRREACQFWGFDPERIDIVAAFGEFYVLDAIAHDLFSGSHLISKEPDVAALCREAKDMQAQLVANIVGPMTDYARMAVWGESRHHKAMSSMIGEEPQRQRRLAGDRCQAWASGKLIEEKVGPDVYLDLAKLSREVGDGGYLGPRWAEAAEGVHRYLTGKIPAQVWVDNMFSMQHNGGSLFNKAPWAIDNDLGWSVDRIKSWLGPAQAGTWPHDWEERVKAGYGPPPTATRLGWEQGQTFWPLLVAVCGGEVKALFSEYWRAMNYCRSRYKLGPIPKPSLNLLAVVDNLGRDRESEATTRVRELSQGFEAWKREMERAAQVEAREKVRALYVAMWGHRPPKKPPWEPGEESYANAKVGVNSGWFGTYAMDEKKLLAGVTAEEKPAAISYADWLKSTTITVQTGGLTKLTIY